MRDIGKNIRDLRERAKLTQDALAEQLCTTRQTISNYERGKTRPDVEQVLRLAAVFGTDANAILYGPPGAERRRDARLRTVLSGMIWSVLQTGYWLLAPAAEEQHRVYLNVMPKGLLWLLLRPVTLLVFGWFLMQLISLVTARKPLKTKRAVHVQIILIILAGLSIALPSLSCVAVTQFRKDGLLPEWLNTMFVQIFVYSYVWAKHTVYLYPLIGAALRLLNVPAQQKPVCKDV